MRSTLYSFPTILTMGEEALCGVSPVNARISFSSSEYFFHASTISPARAITLSRSADCMRTTLLYQSRIPTFTEGYFALFIGYFTCALCIGIKCTPP